MAAIDQLITDNIDVWSSAVQTKSGQGRGSSKKLSLYGIKKLRELILELAVRGLLVPQNPDDEPATVMLEKISLKKKQLFNEKKIKKPRKLASINEDEKYYKVPDDWDWIRIEDAGHNWGQKKPVNKFTYVDVGAINKELGFIAEPTVLEAENAPSRARKIVKKGTVIYSTVRPYLLNIAVIDKEFKPEPIASTAFAIIHPFDGLVAEYIYYYLRSLTFIQYVEGCQTGIAYPAINDKQFFSGLIPIPPTDEQHRIVAKVDELMTLCNQLEQQQEDSITAHKTLVETLLSALTNAANKGDFSQAWTRIAEHFDTLFTTEHSIDQLKQTILQLAVMGKLVPQDPNDEPASVLLEKIAVEKERLVKEKKIKKQKVLPPIGEDEKPFELPIGWEWCRLDDLALNSEAGWSPRCEANPREIGDWGVLKVSAVTWGVYKPEENKALPSNLDPREQYEVLSGDFLISRANTAELVARAVVAPDDSPSKLMMSDKIIRFRFSSSVYNQFINLVNNSELSRAYYAAVAGGTSSSMKNVSREQIRNLLIAIPPKEEQHRIVSKVHELMVFCEELKAHINVVKTTQLHLAEAMAEQALN